jgi:hypothetical protein
MLCTVRLLARELVHTWSFLALVMKHRLVVPSSGK